MANKLSNLTIAFLVVFGTVFSISSGVFAADVDVYLEGAYDDTNLDVYIYADFHVDNVISYGVRLEFDSTELKVVSAAKNDAPIKYTSNQTKWELGSGVNKDNPNPVILENAVVFKGGILNEAAPTDGVVEKVRVFLGTVKFAPAVDGDPMPAAPAVTLTYAEDYSAEPTSYKNFVQYVAGPPAGGAVLDSGDNSGVNFGPINIFERGDANADGFITSADMLKIRSIRGGIPIVYADCNADGFITSADMLCVRNKR